MPANPSIKVTGNIYIYTIAIKVLLSYTLIYLTHLLLLDSSLEILIQEVIEANNRGVSAARNVSGEPNWSFGQSLFFASTVVTTIGEFFNNISE